MHRLIQPSTFIGGQLLTWHCGRSQGHKGEKRSLDPRPQVSQNTPFSVQNKTGTLTRCSWWHCSSPPPKWHWSESSYRNVHRCGITSTPVYQVGLSFQLFSPNLLFSIKAQHDFQFWAQNFDLNSLSWVTRKQKWPHAYYSFEHSKLSMKTVVHVPKQTKSSNPASSLLSPSVNMTTFALPGQKGHWSSPYFKAIVASRIANENKFQLLLLDFSPSLHHKYVYLEKNKKVFKIHNGQWGLFYLTHFLKAIVGHDGSSTC